MWRTLWGHMSEVRVLASYLSSKTSHCPTSSNCRPRAAPPPSPSLSPPHTHTQELLLVYRGTGTIAWKVRR